MKAAHAVDTLWPLLARLWRHLSLRRQRQFVLVLGLTVASAFAEIISLGAVLPFLGVLTAPDRVFARPTVAALARQAGIGSAGELVLPLTVLFVASALLAGAVRMTLLWVGTRLSYSIGADLSMEAYRRTLYQPYPVHVGMNSSEVISGITNKINGVVWGVLLSLMILISAGVLLVAVTLALIVIDPGVASVAALGFGSSYGLIVWGCRRRLLLNSKRVADKQTEVVKALQEGLGGIRDVLLDWTQPVYCDIYRRADLPLRRAQGNSYFISQSPRYAMEALGMVLIAGLAFGLSRQRGGFASALPMLGALALGAQRLLPALQQCYNSWASMVGNQAALDETLAMLDQPLPADLQRPAPPPLPFNEAIRFSGARFRYLPGSPWVLKALDLTIPKGCRVGLVGSTGSGKSTTLDLLMGLLPLTEGELLVDGEPIGSNRLRAWQQTIAHVPQIIFLSDATVAENIAFGVPREAIDLERVHQAARQAQIHDFILGYPDGYDAYVGERGIRLSGGQRQRLCIARALYKKASVLVFDEATSALDSATEQAVIAAIESLDRDLTIVMVAHRLSTVRHCDIIVELDGGHVVAQGSYDYLLEHSATFRNLAVAAHK